MISVDPFLAFSDLAFHFENTGIGIFWLHYVPDSKETKPASSDQEDFPSVVKSAEVVLVYVTHVSVSLQILPVVWIFPGSLGVICYNK